MEKNLIYDINDKPKFGQLIIFAIQQLLAIMAATLVVPVIVGNGMSSAAALFGAGVGTLVYQLFTRFKSPVFLGSSFAFLNSLGVAVAYGYCGIVLGSIVAGLVYVVIAIIVKAVGTAWVGKLLPPIIIGPTVALIGLSLAGAAMGDIVKANSSALFGGYNLLGLLCGLVTFATVIICSTQKKYQMPKLIPFILGILVGYGVAAIFTVIGIATDNAALQMINFAAFKEMQIFAIPDFSFIEAFKGVKDIDGAFIATIAVAYIPVAFVVFAEHIADHKNLSSIIEKDLLEEPGLHRTLLGDGVGSFAGAFFGGCPNTTYGESVGCVAITKNASVITITTTAIMCMVISFFGPFVTFLASIPNCVMGGVCIALYGFIAVSGLKMIQKVDLNEGKNLFVVSSILIPGIGGLSVSFGKVTLTTIACALILGIITNIILNRGNKGADKE